MEKQTQLDQARAARDRNTKVRDALEQIIEFKGLPPHAVLDMMSLMFPKHAEQAPMNEDVYSLLIDLIFLAVWGSSEK